MPIFNTFSFALSHSTSTKKKRVDAYFHIPRALNPIIIFEYSTQKLNPHTRWKANVWSEWDCFLSLVSFLFFSATESIIRTPPPLSTQLNCDQFQIAGKHLRFKWPRSDAYRVEDGKVSDKIEIFFYRWCEVEWVELLILNFKLRHIFNRHGCKVNTRFPSTPLTRKHSRFNAENPFSFWLCWGWTSETLKVEQRKNVFGLRCVLVGRRCWRKFVMERGKIWNLDSLFTSFLCPFRGGVSQQCREDR